MAKSKPRPEKTSDLVAFVKNGSQHITLGDFTKLEASMPEIRKEIAHIRKTCEIPHLATHLDFLADVVMDFVSGKFPELPCIAAAEVAFALQYFVRAVDIIPDFIPDIGLVDDATVALIVLQDHEKHLCQHPAARKIDWAALHG
jgi:uncharacterized membrane protein YkvA (DUF1232 family)